MMIFRKLPVWWDDYVSSLGGYTSKTSWRSNVCHFLVSWVVKTVNSATGRNPTSWMKGTWKIMEVSNFFLFISFCRGLIFRCHGSTSGVFSYTFLSTEHDVFRVVSKLFWVLHFFENDEVGNPYEPHLCPENMTDDEGNARATYSFTCTGQFAKCLKCFVNIPSLKQWVYTWKLMLGR